MAQRLVRAKRKIREAGIPYGSRPTTRCPSGSTPCSPSSTWSSTRATRRPRRRADPRRAVRRGDPARPAAGGADARRAGGARAAGADAAARLAPRGARSTATASSCCSRTRTARVGRGARSPRARALVARALRAAAAGPVRAAGGDRRRARARPTRDTDWPQIAALYDALLARAPTPVVELNRAVAVAMADGPEARPRAIERLDGLDGLPPLPRRPRRPAAPARPRGGGARGLRACARARAERGRARVPRAPPRSVRDSGDRLDLEQRAGDGERRDLDERATPGGRRRRTPCRTGLIARAVADVEQEGASP